MPSYSQMVHSGHYPQWGGGGEAWCSPTSTSMVLAYYGALPKPYALPLRARRPPGPVGRLRRPQDLRRGVRGHRQLAVQHRVRRPARRRRLRHPAAVAARGRDVHRRRHPAGGLGLVGRGRADRRAGLVVQRPPAGDRRLHRRRRPGRQRPRGQDRRRRAPRLRPRASSRTPGCPSPAASSTSSTTTPTRCRPRRPRPTGEAARDRRSARR